MPEPAPLQQPGLCNRLTQHRAAILAILIFAFVAALLCAFGSRGAAVAARALAQRRLRVWAIGDAQQWLAWAQWFDASDGQASLLQATCFRRLQQSDRWAEAMEAARRNGAPPSRVQQEVRLHRIQSGHFDGQAEGDLVNLIESGVPVDDVLTAYLLGHYVRGEPAKIGLLLDTWSTESPNDPQLAYARGLRCKWTGEYPQAQAWFETALSRAPDHTLARSALVKLDEDLGRLENSLKRHADWLDRSPNEETAALGLVRVLRKTARIDLARKVLAPLVREREPGPQVALEKAEIELDAGNYAEALAWLTRLPLDRTTDYDLIYAAACTFAFDQQAIPAQNILVRGMIAGSRAVRANDLQVRLLLDPTDSAAAAELQDLFEPGAASNAGASVTTRRMGMADSEGDATPGAAIYAEYCSACHGINGDGRGRAARHCFPRPRNLRTDAYRLIRSRTGVPTLDDVIEVLGRGMPGTAMRSFENLGEGELLAVTETVLQFRQEGLREQFVASLEAAGEEVDASEVQEVVEMGTAAGEMLPVPQIGAGGIEAVARGRALYFELGCHHCHGQSGDGAGDMRLFDSNGLPTRARDLVHEPFKGGREPESVYLRIAAGMPGTPHPATWGVPDELLVDLVHFCLSLARRPERALTNHDRMLLATGQTDPSAKK